MQLCYICASPLEEESTACGNCHTLRTSLDELERVPMGNRFLFGSVSQDKSASPPEEPVKKEAPVAQDPVKKPPKRRKPAIKNQPSLFRDFDEEPDAPSLAEMVVLREPVIEDLHEEETIPFLQRTVAHFLDLVFCFALNVSVLGLILYLVERELADLLAFSLIPMFFVFMTLTGLYYMSFITLTKKTVGHVLAEMALSKESTLNEQTPG